MAHPELDGLIGGPKAKWLREHQSEVADYWWERGTAATLVEFQISMPRTLGSLLERVGVILQPAWECYQGIDSVTVLLSLGTLSKGAGRGKSGLIFTLPYSELAQRETPDRLGGMAKHKWLQLHRDDILDYYRGHGFEATRLKYYCSDETLGRFLLMPRDEKGRILWRSAIPIPTDYISRKLDILENKVLEEMDWRRDIMDHIKSLRRDMQAFLWQGFNGIAGALDRALPESKIGDLIRQELHRLPSLQQPSLSIPELYTEATEVCQIVYNAINEAEKAKLLQECRPWRIASNYTL